MHGHPWYGFGLTCLLSAVVAFGFHLMMRAVYARFHSWDDVRVPALGISVGIGLFGALFYLALMLHIFR